MFRFMKRKKEGISGKESIAEQRLRTRFMNIPQSSKELQKRTDQRLFKIYRRKYIGPMQILCHFI